MKPRVSSYVASIAATASVLAIIFIGSSSAQAHAFDDVKTSFATLLNIDAPSAGWILGIVFVFVLLVAIMFAIPDRVIGLMTAGIAVTFVFVIGWWPPASVILIGLIVALLLIRPFGGSGE